MEEGGEPPRANPGCAGRAVGLGRVGARPAGRRLGERCPAGARPGARGRRDCGKGADRPREAGRRAEARPARREERHEGRSGNGRRVAGAGAEPGCARRIPFGAREGDARRRRCVHAGLRGAAVRGARARLGRHRSTLEGPRPDRPAGLLRGRSRARLGRGRGLRRGRRRAIHARDADAGRRRHALRAEALPPRARRRRGGALVRRHAEACSTASRGTSTWTRSRARSRSSPASL